MEEKRGIVISEKGQSEPVRAMADREAQRLYFRLLPLFTDENTDLAISPKLNG